MNILLINPPNVPFSQRELLIEPIDMLTLATYLQEFNNHVRFLDMDCQKMNEDDLKIYLKEQFMPDIVIISYDYHIPIHTQEALENITDICKTIKEYKIKTIMIGKTVTYNPKIVGILIVAEGADDNKLSYKLTKMVSSLYDISESKVNVIPMKE